MQLCSEQVEIREGSKCIIIPYLAQLLISKLSVIRHALSQPVAAKGAI